MLTKLKYAALVLAVVAAPTSFANVTPDSASSTPLASLNQTIAKLVAPLQDANTQASLDFKKIKTDATRALKLSLAGDFKKTGPANTVELRVDHLRYKYGDGTQPTTSFKGFAGADLTKILSQDELHQLIPNLQQSLQDLVGEFFQDYGNAAHVTVRTYDMQQDAQGNYISLRGTVKLHIDLSQLPQSTPSSDVIFTDALLHLSVALSQGVKFNGKVVSNPAYEDFQSDQTGLKEYLDQLLSQNPDTLAEIGDLFEGFNNMADTVVNGQGLSRSISP